MNFKQWLINEEIDVPPMLPKKFIEDSIKESKYFYNQLVFATPKNFQFKNRYDRKGIFNILLDKFINLYREYVSNHGSNLEHDFPLIVERSLNSISEFSSNTNHYLILKNIFEYKMDYFLSNLKNSILYFNDKNKDETNEFLNNKQKHLDEINELKYNLKYDKDYENYSIIKEFEKKFNILVDYLNWAKKYESEVKLLYDSYIRRKESMGKGEESKPKHEEIETLYHATPYVNEILKEGFKINQDRKGLGGATDNAISFTADINIAKAIVRSLREVVSIAKGEWNLNKVIKFAKISGVDEPELKKRIKWYEKHKYGPDEQQKKYIEKGLLGWDSIIKQDDQKAKEELFNIYRLAIAMNPERYDPLYFGIELSDFQNINVKNIGILACKVNMNTVKKYLSSMEEYRVPLEGILSIKEIK